MALTLQNVVVARAVLGQVPAGPDSSENSGDPAVGAALGHGCGHARRCATTVAGLDVQKTVDFSTVSVHDKV